MKLKVFHEDEWREYPTKTYTEYTHEWLGEPHASESVRLDGGGNEVARNPVRDPRFVSGDWRPLLTNPVYGGWENGYGVELRRNQGGASSRTGFFFTLDEYVSGEAVTVSFDAQRVVDGGNFRAMILDSADNENRSTVMAITTERDRYVVHLGGDLDFNRVCLDFLNNEDPGPGGTIGYLDRVIVEPGHTDGSYFDGDTVPDRAWVDFQPRNISGIKRIWRQSTPPPAGTHYAWEGEPNSSPSIKYVDGVEVARNLYPDPSFRSGSLVRNTMSAGAASRELSSEWSLSGGQSLKHESRYDSSGSAYLIIYRSSMADDGRYDWLPDDIRGKWLGASITLHKPEDDSDQQYSLGRLWFFSPHTQHISQQGVDTQRLKVAFPVPLTGSYHTRLYHHGPRDSPPIYWDELSLSVADTEAEALAQVSDYFDGDTESDRAHDLWYNSDGVPHEWVNGQGWTEL